MTIVAQHNGGRSQVNLYFAGSGGTMSFIDVAKQGSNFKNKSDNIFVDPATLDANGYPTAGSYYALAQVSNDPSVLGASWTMTWDGNGSVDIPGPIQTLGPGTTLVSAARASSGDGGGSVTFLTGPNGKDFLYGAHSTAAAPNHVRNIKIYLTSEAARLAAGEYFGLKFLQRLAEANFGVIRFLDWQKGNTTTITSWASRKPVSYATWSDSEMRASSYCGATTNIGNAYSITGNGVDIPASGGPTDKMTLLLKFNADGDGTSTLSLNGGAAKTILNPYSNALSSFAVHFPKGGRYAALVYDAVLNAWIKQGGDTEVYDVGIDNGVPPEVMVRLCAEVGAHPHFVTPVMSIDPATDYMPSLAAYCRDSGPSWMVPRFEGPNELWNNFGGFYQTGYANAKATAYGWGADFHNWYGKAMSVLGQIVASAYGVAFADVKTQTKYQVLSGVQTSEGGNPGPFAPRMLSTKYLLQTPQSPYTATAASGWVTHLCCAQYMNPSDQGQAGETTKSNAFLGVRFQASIVAGAMTVSAIDTSGGALAIGKTLFGRGIGNGTLASGVTITGGSAPNWTLSDSSLTASGTFYAGTDMTAPGAYIDTLNSGTSAFNLAGLISLYTGWKAWAAAYGVTRMTGYEGGYSPDYTTVTGAVDVLRYAGKLVPALKGYLKTNYRNFLTAGGEYPSMYFLAGTYPSSAAWAVLEDIYQTPNPPQWTAAVEFNAALATLTVKV